MNINFIPFKRLITAALLLTVSLNILAADWKNKDWPFINPSEANTNQTNYLVERKEFTMSYNNDKGTPNWVAWSLEKNDIGKAPRVEFYPDEDLPRSFKRVLPRDYNKTGFDRGHMCNHEDRSSTIETSRATFTMANMVPQSPDLNRKAWEKLEAYSRRMVQKGVHVHVICGPAGIGGEGSEGEAKDIGKSRKVTVPACCWKIIVIAGADEKPDLSKTIAVIMPNKMGVGEDWKPYKTTVEEVEKLTGYKFFSK